MKSQPLQTAFTSMTIALVIFLSIWVIQASQDELNGKSGVALQVKADPDSREVPKRDPRPDPFADPGRQSEVPAATRSEASQESKARPTVEMQGIQVRGVPEHQVSPATTEINLFDKIETNPTLTITPDEPANQSELQAKIDSLTREHADLKIAFEREQENLNLALKEKENVAAKLGESESELVRLNSTTKALRSEAADMKNSLNRVTREFESLSKRVENLQKKPQELNSQPIPSTEAVFLQPREFPPPRKEEFLPPIKKNPQTGAPLAPPSEDPSHFPLIEAEPDFQESKMDEHYPPMVTCENCTETTETCKRGPISKLFRKLRLINSDSCTSCSAVKTPPVSCSETGTCEPEPHIRRGIFYRLSDLIHKDDADEPEECLCEPTTVCEPGRGESQARGLIPQISRWIEARKTHGCFSDCNCGCQ